MPNIDWQGMTLLLFTLLATILLLVGLYLLRRNKPSLDPTNQLYQRFLLKLEKVGFIKQDYESALCFANRIKSSRQDLATEVDNITRFYNMLRYTAHPPQYLLARLQSAINQFQPQRFR